MKRVTIISLGLALSWALVGCGQKSSWTEDDWQPLVDEPSRHDLQRTNSMDDVEIETVPYQFQFPRDATGGTYGIDVSHYSPANLPFSKFAANGVHYVYAKATQGTAFKDSKFKTFWSKLAALPASQRVYRGAYHFLTASTASDPELQAERFVAYVKLQGGFKAGDLPPVVDLEWDKATANGVDRWKYLTPAQIVTKVQKFLVRVEKLTGRVPMIYTSEAWRKERGLTTSQVAQLARYKVWMADYSSSSRRRESPVALARTTPALWQFTDQSKVPGLTSKFDGNVFDGTLTQFVNLFAQ